jgi:hypothetical protein
MLHYPRNRPPVQTASQCVTSTKLHTTVKSTYIPRLNFTYVLLDSDTVHRKELGNRGELTACITQVRYDMLVCGAVSKNKL